MFRRLIISKLFHATLGVLALAVCAIVWVDSIGGPVAFREQYGRTAPLLTVPVHCVLAILPLPTDPICIANGAVYGFWWGAALSWIGWYVAALAKFAIGRRARVEFDLKSRMQRLPSFLQRFPIHHPVFLIGARVVPYVGGNVSTFLPGAAGVSYRRHLWCSAIAIVPGSLVTAAVGVGLLQL